MERHEAYMRRALALAQEAYEAGEVPVGALVVWEEQVVAAARNRREEDNDPTAHAEILALRQAAKTLGRRRLTGCSIYVTLEPCPMCAGALVMANLDICYFAARDDRQGCAESVYALTQDPAFYHRLPCVGGVLAQEAEALLKQFFGEKRKVAGKSGEPPIEGALSSED